MSVVSWCDVCSRVQVEAINTKWLVFNVRVLLIAYSLGTLTNDGGSISSLLEGQVLKTARLLELSSWFTVGCFTRHFLSNLGNLSYLVVLVVSILIKANVRDQLVSRSVVRHEIWLS